MFVIRSKAFDSYEVVVCRSFCAVNDFVGFYIDFSASPNKIGCIESRGGTKDLNNVYRVYIYYIALQEYAYSRRPL